MKTSLRGTVLAAMLTLAALAACDSKKEEEEAAPARALALPEETAVSEPEDGEVEPAGKGASAQPSLRLLLEVDAPRRLRFRCDTLTLPGCAVTLLDAGGRQVSAGRTEASVKRTDFYLRTPAPGSYTLVVSSAQPGGSGTFRYQLANLGVDTVGDVAAQAVDVTPGTPVTDGLQGTGDVDAFRFPVEADTFYRIQCTLLSSSRPWFITLTLPGQDAPERIDATWETAALFRLATAPGTGIATIERPFGSAPVDTATPYTCTVEALRDDATDELTGPARALPIGEPVTGSFEFGEDIDVFAATLSDARHYRISCDCRLHLFSPSGSQLNPEVGYDPPRLFLTTNAPGEYRIRATGADRRYTVSIEDLSPDDWVNTLDDVRSVVPAGTPLEGTWEVPWDADVFAMDVPTGHFVDFSCTAQVVSQEDRPPTPFVVYGNDVQTVLTYQSYLDETPRNFTVQVPAPGRLYLQTWFGSTYKSIQSPINYRCTWSARAP